MRIRWFQHVPFEGLGAIEPWLQRAGHTLDRTAFWQGDPLPAPASADALIVMGGPMSVHDQDAYPWLAGEQTFIAEFAAGGRPVLGICLGAQLIARALGANVFVNAVKEIGWLPLQAEPGVPNNVFPFPPRLDAFHWHGETFDLPPGATRLAHSEACLNQAFQWSEHVLGLQFHWETTPESAAALVRHCGEECVPSPTVQSAKAILAAPTERYTAAHQALDALLAYWLRD